MFTALIKIETCADTQRQAVAAGYEVAVTASKRNFEYCLGIGASHVFDYAGPNVVEDIIKEFRGRDCAGVFCSINAEGVVGKCSQIADQLPGNKVVAIPLPPAVPVSDKIPGEVTIVQCKH